MSRRAGREGSPWTGLGIVVAKETADHLTSARMRLLEILIFLAAGGAVYAAIENLRNGAGEDPFLFLRLFTVAREPLPSLLSFLGFLVPLVAIGLGFDAINSEYTRRTLSRILAQPIYRDALLMGKFLAGLLTLAITFLALWLLVTGLGLLFLGVPPTGEEVVRGFGFLITTIAYAGVWLALAQMFSVVFRQPATSALAALAVWLFLTFFWPILAGVLAGAFTPDTLQAALTGQAYQLELALSRIAPDTLYAETGIALLNPETRTLGPVFVGQLHGALLGMPLPLRESLFLIWPHVTGLVAAVIVLFTIAYVLFQRQEVRA